MPKASEAGSRKFCLAKLFVTKSHRPRSMKMTLQNHRVNFYVLTELKTGIINYVKKTIKIVAVVILVIFLILCLFSHVNWFDLTHCEEQQNFKIDGYEETQIFPLFLQMYSKEFGISYFDLEKYHQLVEKDFKAIDYVSKPQHIYLKSPEGKIIACGYYK